MSIEIIIGLGDSLTSEVWLLAADLFPSSSPSAERQISACPEVLIQVSLKHPRRHHFLKIEVQLISSIVIIAAVQQSNSVIRICVLFHILFHCDL